MNVILVLERRGAELERHLGRLGESVEVLSLSRRIGVAHVQIEAEALRQLQAELPGLVVETPVGYRPASVTA